MLDVEYTESADVAGTPPPGFTELPTCPVCLGQTGFHLLPYYLPLPISVSKIFIPTTEISPFWIFSCQRGWTQIPVAFSAQIVTIPSIARVVQNGHIYLVRLAGVCF